MPPGSTAYRYEVEGKLLTPVSWSALQEVDLGAVPTDGREHELSLYMQDTGWPDAPLDDYIELWDQDYWQFMRQIPAEKKLLDIVACFQVAHGSGIRPEAILMQKIMNFSTLGNLLTSVEKHDPATWPGTLHGQGARAPRPVGEQAPAHQRLVAALLSLPFRPCRRVVARCRPPGRGR